MAYLDIVESEEAVGELAAAYRRNVDMYKDAGLELSEVPNVYKTNYAAPQYLDFGTLQAACLPNYPIQTEPVGPVPWVVVNFAVSKYSACFY